MRLHGLALVLLWIAGALGAEPNRTNSGDPLPEGAIARLGSVGLRNEELILAAAFTADGKTLAVAGNDFVCFWDLVTGKLARRVKCPNLVRPAGHRCLSADGKTLIQTRPGHRNNDVNIVDVGRGAPQGTLNRPQGGYVVALDLSRDGKVLAVAGRNTIAVFDVPQAKLLHEFKGLPAGSLAPLGIIALTPDGKQLVLPHADGSLYVADVGSGKELRSVQMRPLSPGASHRIQRLAVSPDGRYLAFDGLGTPLTVCELATGKPLHHLASPPGYHLAFTPNGRVLAVTEVKGIRLFDVPSGKEICMLPTKARGFQRLLFSPDGRMLAAINTHIIQLWDMTAQRWLHPVVGHEGMIQAMAFFPDGKRLVSGAFGGEIRVWDIASGQTLAQQSNTPSASLTVDRDGETVRFADYKVSAHRWDPRTGREEIQRQVVGVSTLLTNTLALSPDGRSLAGQAVGRSGRGQKRPGQPLHLYDVKTHKCTVLPELPPQSWVIHVLFAPDSRRLAVYSHDGIVRLWDRDTGKLVRELSSEKSAGLGTHLPLAFASDGRTLLTASGGLLRIRECLGGAVRVQIPVDSKRVKTVTYAPDARFVACGEKNGRILVYSVLSGKQLAQWDGKQGPVDSLAFSRDGRLLASGGANGSILIWKVPQNDSMPAIRNTEEAAVLWQTLGSSDAVAAYRAVASFTVAPAQALPLFKERLRPLAKLLDSAQLARWIAELDDDSFKVRERASHELMLAGPDAAEALRQTLNKNPSAESKRRIDDLLARLKKSDYSRRLHFLRALEVLERIGTPQAKELLLALAGQPLSDEPREEVQASLRRLGEKR